MTRRLWTLLLLFCLATPAVAQTGINRTASWYVYIRDDGRAHVEPTEYITYHIAFRTYDTRTSRWTTRAVMPGQMTLDNGTPANKLITTTVSGMVIPPHELWRMVLYVDPQQFWDDNDVYWEVSANSSTVQPLGHLFGTQPARDMNVLCYPTNID